MLNSCAVLLALVLAPQPAAAQPQQYVPAVFRDYSGGLHDNLPAIYLEQNESPNAQNMVIDEPRGALKPRTGFSLCGNLPSGNAPTALFEFFKTDGTRRLIVSDNVNYYQTPDCQTFLRFYTGASATAQPSFAIIRDKLWVANRSTHVFTFDGSTMTLLDGGANTPNPAPPKCAYLQFWKERAWCARSDANPSGVAFSALTNSDGIAIDPSTGTLSWPAANLFQVDQNGGSPIYGIKAYRDNLYVFKNNGIWRIIFNNEFDNAVVKTLSSVGSRFHNSIVELDNLLYFVGPDGIYAFDGDSSTRISDKILNTFQSLRQPYVNEQSKLWTATSDFDDGTLSRVSTGAVVGSVMLEPSTTTAGTYDNFETDLTAAPAWTQTGGSWSTRTHSSQGVAYNIGGGAGEGNNAYITAPAVATYGIWSFDFNWTAAATFTDVQQCFEFKFISDGDNFFSIRCLGIGSGFTDKFKTRLIKKHNGVETILSNPDDTEVIDRNTLRTLQVVRTSTGAFHWSWNGVTVSSSHDTTEIEASEISVGLPGSDTSISLYYQIDNVKMPEFPSTGTWTSEIYNAVEVSSWSTLSANDQTNGGEVQYFVKVGSDTGAVQQRDWNLITPGSVITGNNDQIYVQVKSSMNATANRLFSPKLRDATVAWLQGGTAAQSIHAAGWKNRLWVAGSTASAGAANDTVLVKSKFPLNSWMKYDMQIGSMARYNDNFYAAASTHSAIYRLDHGTNDNGRAIDAFWETRDEVWGQPGRKKGLMEIGIDAQLGTASQVSVGYSRDNGATFTDKTFSLTGTGRGSRRWYVNGGNSLNYRFRLRSNLLDQQSFSLYGLDGYATMYQVRE